MVDGKSKKKRLSAVDGIEEGIGDGYNDGCKDGCKDGFVDGVLRLFVADIITAIVVDPIVIQIRRSTSTKFIVL